MCSTGLTAHFDANKLDQKRSVPTPNGEHTPNPVTTTRLLSGISGPFRVAGRTAGNDTIDMIHELPQAPQLA